MFNGLNLPTLLGLLQQGQAPQGAPQPVPGAAVAPPVLNPAAPVEEEVVVQSPRAVPSQYKRGLLGGAFGVGKTGGNILGMIGDAFLTQSGNAPRYAPRLQQVREAEALRDYRSDPEGALARYSKINPQDGLDRFDKFEDNQRQRLVADAQARAATQKYDEAVTGRVHSLLGSATDDATYQPLLQQARRYAEAKGVEVDLPDTFDGARIAALRLSDIPVEEQEKARALKEYRDAGLGIRRGSADDLRAHRQGSLGVARTRAGTSARQGDARIGISSAGLTERQRHNRVMEARPVGGNKKGASDGAALSAFKKRHGL